jgi:hypothetical protein
MMLLLVLTMTICHLQELTELQRLSASGSFTEEQLTGGTFS